MPSKTRPYDQFGNFILFKKLEADPLSELWRAARIDDRHLGPLVALRRLIGGDREALVRAASDAREMVPMLTGTSFVKEQAIDVINGVPFIAHAYSGGRSLRHIVDRARGGAGVTPNPVSIDQAIHIAERIALSLTTLNELRYSGHRLSHGALIPQFVWIEEDGEIRVAGQQLGRGLIASMKDAKVAAAIGRYFSPEYQHSGEPTQASEVFAMGAILFLLVTGIEPPDAAHVSAFSQHVRATRTMAGEPIPDDIRGVLEKSLSIDPARRYGSVADMKQALSGLAHGGKYSATTFNLAFYLSTLLKKEVEGENVDREKESKVNVAPYLEHQVDITAPIPVAPQERSKMPLVAAAVLVVAAIGVGGFWMMRGSAANAKSQIASPTRPATRPPTPPPVVPQPIVATATSASATTATIDPAAQKKAFEDAVNRKMQEEMLKMQSQFDKQLQQKKSKNAAVSNPPAVLTASVAPQRTETMDDRSPSAAAFDERRLAARTDTVAPQTVVPAPVTQTQAPVPVPQPQIAAAAPVPTPGVKEGDVVKFDELDERPVLTTQPHINYPPMAMRQRIESSVILTALISETGDVIDVNVLRGDARFGFNEAAIRAMRTAKFRPAMKDGKRVRTWLPQPIDFKLK
ncbi:MAG: TonB family protein [Acidobacteriota bacterium]|nr:TonB family protein [Acidobacteriota bacterium]